MIKYSNNDKQNTKQFLQHGQTTQPRLKVCMCVIESERVRVCMIKSVCASLVFAGAANRLKCTARHALSFNCNP